MHKVIVVTGPPGVGKTTIAELLAKEFHAPILRGDEIKEELFSGLVDISKHPKELLKVKNELLKRAKEIFASGQSVIVDYVVLGNYIREYQRTFGRNLVMKVLLPSVHIIAKRDAERSCWTAGKDHIEQLSNDFRKDEPLIGSEHFIDNGNESPERTAERIIVSMIDISSE